jgi:hypothetical protein
MTLMVAGVAVLAASPRHAVLAAISVRKAGRPAADDASAPGGHESVGGSSAAPP